MSGKPGVTRPCGWGCGANLTAVEDRAHFKTCEKRPKRVKAASKRLREFGERKPDGR